MSITYKLDTHVLDALSRKIKVDGDKVVAALAFQVEANVKGNIIRKDIIDTGALLGSVHTEKKSEKTYWVADGVEYGIYHELGTSKMAARPFMTPAVETVYMQVASIVKEEIDL